MNENTTKLIEQLAQKLGTTSEYLWGILLRQSYVSAWTSLIGVMMWVLACLVLYRFHKYFTSKDGEYSSYYDENENVKVIMVVCFLVLLLGFIFMCGCTIPNILNGFLNPEYSALNTILEGIKK